MRALALLLAVVLALVSCAAPEGSPRSIEAAATATAAITSATPERATAIPSPSATAQASATVSATPESSPASSPSADASATPATPQPVAVPVSAAPGHPSGLALFRRPFDSDIPVHNFHDHDLPQEFVDANGYVVTYWGERLPKDVSFDGHEGYDWDMPEGTPLFTVADGTVVIAGPTTPGPCPVLNNAIVQGVSVYLEHRVLAPSGEALTLRSRYSHLSRVDVSVGDIVGAGTRIGLSGNTGCSTAPHLHFEVYRYLPSTRRYVTIDPYGWEGAGDDPWAVHPRGAGSIWLWRDALSLYKEYHQAANTPSGNAAAAVTGVRWMGYRDDVNPNNEFVEISLDPRYVPSGAQDLTGYTMKNNRGDTYAFPQTFTLRRERPIRVYTGFGQNGDTALYWGRASGVWDNSGDCVRLVTPRGGTYTIRTANITCPR